MLADALSAAVSYVPGSLVLDGVPIPDTGNYDSVTRTIGVSLPPVPPGAIGSLTFQVTVGPWSASRAGIANIGSFAASGSVVATTPPVYHYVDSLDITKTVRNLSASTGRTGSVLKWTIVVRNRGIVPATNVYVTDSVPVYTTYVKGSITGPGADGGSPPALHWNVGTIPVGHSVTLTFKSTINKNAPNKAYISNRASVRADQGPPKNSPTVRLQVNDTPSPVLRTSGAENITLGLMCLLGALSLGFAWSGRPRGGPAGKRTARITAAVLMSVVLAMGGMEALAISGAPVPSPGEAIATATQNVTAPEGPQMTAATATSRVVGRVSIPRIGVSQKLVEGRTETALSSGLWRQPASFKPGAHGACVVAGHRISSQFAKLYKARVGDTVWVTYGSSKYKYRVASVSTLKVTSSTPGFRIGVKQKLVLYTCVPRWQGNKRIVVVCYPVAR